MYDVMAVAGAVWSCPYAWKGLALVTLGREINGNKWLGERIGALKRGFVTVMWSECCCKVFSMFD